MYVTFGICHFVWMTVWYVGWNSTLYTRQSSTHIVTNMKCCIDTAVSPDDGHIVACNM